MIKSNIFQLRKFGHLLLLVTAPIYILLSFVPSLDRYFFVFQLLLFLQGLTLFAQSIVGFGRLKEKNEILRLFIAGFVFISALCIGGIDNSVLLGGVPAWMYIYYFAGYLPAFVLCLILNHTYPYQKSIKIIVDVLSVFGIISSFVYFFLYAEQKKYIAYSLPVIGGNFGILSIALVEILLQLIFLVISIKLFRTKDKNKIHEHYKMI